jgi:hypothetical protein
MRTNQFDPAPLRKAIEKWTLQEEAFDIVVRLSKMITGAYDDIVIDEEFHEKIKVIAEKIESLN